MASTDVTPSGGLNKDEGITFSWSPLDDNEAAITGAAANITLTIEEPGEDAITKTGGDLTESSGTYSYEHKTAVAGTIGRGSWAYDGPSNADANRFFHYTID